MDIRLDDLSGADIAYFLQEHIDDMRSMSPPESKHALDLDGLRAPEITFWTMYRGDELVGCAALKALDDGRGEVKSMRVKSTERGGGLGSALLHHVVHEAKQRQYRSLLLETGSMAFFEPARALYAKHGFELRGPFGSYKEDPHSVFMELHLAQ